MNALTEKSIVNVPRRIFDFAESDAMVATIRAYVEDSLTARASLTEPLRRRLVHYPRLIGTLIADQVLPDAEIDLLLTDPTVCCSMVLEHYDKLAPDYECRVYHDPRSVERILRDVRFTARRSVRTDAEYMEMLRDEPDRYTRMMLDKDRVSLVQQEMAVLSESRAVNSAAWAHWYIITHHVQTITPALLEQLCRDEEYLFLVARLQKHSRKLPSEVWGPLVAKITQPKWVYHALLSKTYSEEQMRTLFELLHEDPLWVAEYWQIADLNNDIIEKSLCIAIERQPMHECISELTFHYKSELLRRSALVLARTA